MKLTTHNPWNSFNRLHSDLDRLFNYWTNISGFSHDDSSTNVMSSWAPSIDLKEEEDRYVLKADVPGVESKDIEITMEDGVLTIQGERNLHNTEEDKGYRRTERVQGKFYRRFSLPNTVDGDGIEAKSNNGVLEVIIPKQEKAKPRRITVSS